MISNRLTPNSIYIAGTSNGLINTPRTQANTTQTTLEEFAEMFAEIFFA
jgi:hypothetical protein